jgi:hypothetical protein
MPPLWPAMADVVGRVVVLTPGEELVLETAAFGLQQASEAVKPY